MTVIAPGPLSTLSYAAVITWKQIDILHWLLESDEVTASPRTTKQVSWFLTELRDEAIACGDHIYYWGTSYSAVYGTLKTLEARGLVQRRYCDDRWWITRKGMDAYERSFG